MLESVIEDRGEKEFTKARQVTPGALTVLFQPTEVHIQTLLRLKQLCGHVVAVDNSPASDLQVYKKLHANDIDILTNSNRGGIAGAYNRGIEWLIERKCQIIFFFDQDSEVPDNYFTQMLDDCATLVNPLFLIGPKIFDVNVNRYLPAHIVRKFGLTPIPITEQDQGLLPCSSVISSGSVLSAETYRALGPFVEDYFIDQVDTEYSFRALCKGIPIYINTALTLRHAISKRIDHKVLFFKLIQWNMIPLRQYYSARNCINISRRYGAQFPLLVLINIITVQQIISVILFEEDKRKKMVAMAAGILDGLRNRCGAFEACWPRVFSFCTKP